MDKIQPLPLLRPRLMGRQRSQTSESAEALSRACACLLLCNTGLFPFTPVFGFLRQVSHPSCPFSCVGSFSPASALLHQSLQPETFNSRPGS